MNKANLIRHLLSEKKETYTTEELVRVLQDHLDAFPEEHLSPEQYYYRCPCCGHNLIWESDFMLSEIQGLDYPDDPEADPVVGIWDCPNCNVSCQLTYYPSGPQDHDDTADTADSN